MQTQFFLFLFQTLWMSFFFVLSFPLHNAGLIDFAWPSSFTLTVVYFLFHYPLQTRLLVISIGYLLCGLRFMFGWIVRSRHEDRRWELWRQKWKRGEWRLLPIDSISAQLLIFYLIQGWANAFSLVIPVLVMGESDREPNYFGVLVWLFGFVFENVADMQLAKFRTDKKNRGRVCRNGLWAYSRHPNYFGEWLIWIGYVIYCWPAAWALGGMYLVQVITIPFVGLFFLLGLTGVPITEEASVLHRGQEYSIYQKEVPMFFPKIF